MVVLKSDGPVFSSGHDLREMVGSDEESYTCIFAECTEVMEAIRLLPQPVIAQVQGLATAAGCQLVATCDLAVASEDAGFCTPGRTDWPVLLHSGGGPVPSGQPQARHGNAADGHPHLGPNGP